MPRIERQVYVISDLHLGGVYPDGSDPLDRGFRICTRVPEVAAFVRSVAERGAGDPAVELVINGDLVDFLAERHESGSPWRPFCADPDTGVRLLRAIVERDRVVFDALAAFLAAGHRLVILLGNHDVELALPQVRAELGRALGAAGKDFVFIHDGEAYIVGDALIEHGNEYDLWNRVNHAQLRRIRTELSRGRTDGLDFFEPPPGSSMVAEVINPIKESYRFIDLLKPEKLSAIPLLLALEPGYRSLLTDLARNGSRAAAVEARRVAARAIGADISATGAGEGAGAEPLGLGDGPLGPTTSGGALPGAPAAVNASDPPAADHSDPLAAELEAVLGEGTRAFLEAVGADGADAVDGDSIGADISSAGGGWKLGFARLLAGSGASPEALRTRMPALLQALQATQDDASFERSREAGKEYWEAAVELARGPIKHVVFGHTHLPKKVPLPSGGFYLNSGTWADVLRFPREMVAGRPEEAMARVEGFVEAMRRNDFSAFTVFRPTYVRLDVGHEGTVVEAELCDHPVAEA